MEAYVDLADPERQLAMLADAPAAALAVGSTSLLAASIGRGNRRSRVATTNAWTKVLRYLIRMSTRPAVRPLRRHRAHLLGRGFDPPRPRHRCDIADAPDMRG